MQQSPVHETHSKSIHWPGWTHRAFRRASTLFPLLVLVLAGSLLIGHALSYAEPSSGPALAPDSANSEPSWWQELNTYGGGNSSLKMLHLFDVIGWGYGAYTEWTQQLLRRQVARMHAQGGRYMGELQLWDIYSLAEHPELLNAVVIDIDGQPVETFDSTPEDPLYWGNTNHPIYQAYLRDQCRAMVDLGVDGITIDEMNGTSAASSGSFGEPDMSMFRTYLADHYTPQELLNQFGIADIETFDYGQYIHDNDLVDEWKTAPWSVPLNEDYNSFQENAIHNFLTELVSDTKAYAQTTYGRELAFTGNVYGFMGFSLIFTPLLDFYTVEYMYREYGYPPQSQAIPAFKRTRALRDQPALFIPGDMEALAARDSTSTLLTIFIAEAYASQGAMMEFDKWFGYTVDWDALAPVYRFVQDNAFLYEELDSLAQVAVLYSHRSDMEGWVYYLNPYRGLTYALLDGHIQYDVLVLGDDIWLDDTLSAAGLAPYQLVFLPNAAYLSNSQVDTLLSFVNGGGVVVAWGDTGIYDETGQEADRPELETLTVTGTHSYGAGWFITLTGDPDPGDTYRQTHDPAVRQQLVAPVNEYAGRVTTTSAPRTLNILAYERMNGSQLIAHLINYDYDLETDQVTSTVPFTMALQTPAGFLDQDNVQLYRMSPPHTVPSLLNFAIDGSLLVIDHPGVEMFDVLIALLEADAADLAGEVQDDLNSQITQAQAEGYDTSSLNDVLTQIDDAVAAGNHLLARQLGLEALDQLHLLTRKRVLFDEAHGEGNTISWERAVEMAPEHPDWVYFGTLTALEDEFVFERNPDASLNLALLQNYDALLLSAPTETLDAQELEAVRQFTANGGGLIVLGDCGLDGPVNEILADYDITFDPHCILGPWPLDTDFVVDTFADHPAVNEAPFIMTNYAQSLTTGDSAVVLATTDDDIWQDTDWDEQYDPGEPMGPFPVAAAYEIGHTRVAAVADNPFMDDEFTGRMNDWFLRSLLNWVTGRRAPYDYHVYLPLVLRGWGK